MSPVIDPEDGPVSTGIAGLDDVMAGGFRRKRLFLVEGVPGSGKTTLAMQFLIAAAGRGEKVLYVTLSETAEELRASAASHGWVLDGIEIRELTPAEHRQQTTSARLPSGIPELDKLLGGGIEEGTSTLIVGAAGTGKSTIAAQFAAAAAGRGQRSALFVFDESPQTLLSRCDELHVDLRRAVEAGDVTVQPIDPVELSPGEFIHAIRAAVEERKASIIVIDSLNGYLNAMPEERFLTIQLHELLVYLGQRGVATILIGAHQGLIGSQMTTPIDATYLADAVILLRYFEARGEVRQVISVMKKRGSNHERTIRELRLDGGRIQVGEALRTFRGILTGVPVYEGATQPREDRTAP
jgi:circadian clock protein KaiC